MQNSFRDHLSLRHLPDLSNTSFSFEIPSGSNEEFLLDNDVEFFGAAGDSFATPAPNRIVQQLTPKAVAVASLERRYPESGGHSSPTKSSLPLLSNSSLSNSPRLLAQEAPGKARARTAITKGLGILDVRNEVMSTPQRMQRLKDEIKALAESKHTSDFIEQEVAKPNSTAPSSGDISDSMKINQSPRVPRPAHAGHSVSSPAVHTSVENSTSDTFGSEEVDMSVISTAGGGLAKRLVMYSENLANKPHELSNLTGHDIGSALTGSLHPQGQMSNPSVINDLPKTSVAANDFPLTLSQLSPSKEKFRCSTPDPQPSDVSVSPMRQSRKRVGSPVPNAQPRKKEKMTAVSSFSRANLSATHTVIKKRTPSVNSTSASSKARKGTRPVRHANGAVRVPTRGPAVVLKGSSSGLDPSNGSEQGLEASTGSFISSRSGSSKLDVERSGSSMKTSGSQPTRPITFNFQSDKRIEARRTAHSSSVRESEEKPGQKQKLHSAYTVPDFKASHAAQEALLTSIKGQITPVVPLPVELHTQARARDRSRFDERVREREAEMEHALEERNRQREEDEEREMKELRKKTIPKAHPVPTWYKDIPRRKEARSQSHDEESSR